MLVSEREFNGALFDQLTLLERIEAEVKQGSMQGILEQIEFERKAIERKLYQPPSITGSTNNM